MAMKNVKAIVIASACVCLMQAEPLFAQSVTAEAAVSAGASTEDEISAAAAQLRGFGDIPGGIRFFTEAAWGVRSEDDSDVFGAAYPYSNRVKVIEAYGERIFRPSGLVMGARAGRFRTPFGISNGSDHGYTGFLRAPLIRYDGYFALSNNYLEHGADLVVGMPLLMTEFSVGRPADVGSAQRRPGTDVVIRLQSFAGPLIVGVSRIKTMPYLPARFATGASVFTGVDVRWIRDGVQLRGEWIDGRPFDGVTTTGWYADAIVHRVGMGPVTAVARIEQLDYDTNPPFALHVRRQTAGARIRLFDGLSAQLNVVHQTGALAESGAVAFDAGFTYSRRRVFPRD
jgi:hypothetical protein